MTANGSVDRPHKHAGKTEAARGRQLANLSARNSLKHGAYSASQLRPVRERVFAELTREFTGIRRDRLELLASLRARIEVITAYVEARGIFKNVQRGEFFPVITLLERAEVAYRAELSKVEELARARQPWDALDALSDHHDQEDNDR